jgi:dTDP-4-dehydrorhamnose reductase
MRLLVTGVEGQVARALQERASAGVEVVAVGRPTLDLSQPEKVARSLEKVDADVIVNAAAYTAVDKAESDEDLAFRINADGAAAVARVAALRNVPLIQLSTDYVFGGALDRPYVEDDPVGPIGAYGRSKLAGERAALEIHDKTLVLRTSWVYAPFGANFVRTMLRVGTTRGEVAVVADQRGAPTSALDIADAILRIAASRPDTFGVFHMTGAGEATWADFAETIFAEAERRGRPPVAVRRISTADYPTAARRPANSRLSNEKFARTFGFRLPDWRASTRTCVGRLLETG